MLLRFPLQLCFHLESCDLIFKLCDSVIQSLLRRRLSLRAPDKRGYSGYFKDIFSYFLMKPSLEASQSDSSNDWSQNMLVLWRIMANYP